MNELSQWAGLKPLPPRIPTVYAISMDPALRPVVNRIAFELDCPRDKAANIVKEAMKEGYSFA